MPEGLPSAFCQAIPEHVAVHFVSTLHFHLATVVMQYQMNHTSSVIVLSLYCFDDALSGNSF